MTILSLLSSNYIIYKYHPRVCIQISYKSSYWSSTTSRWRSLLWSKSKKRRNVHSDFRNRKLMHKTSISVFLVAKARWRSDLYCISEQQRRRTCWSPSDVDGMLTKSGKFRTGSTSARSSMYSRNCLECVEPWRLFWWMNFGIISNFLCICCGSSDWALSLGFLSDVCGPHSVTFLDRKTYFCVVCG